MGKIMKVDVGNIEAATSCSDVDRAKSAKMALYSRFSWEQRVVFSVAGSDGCGGYREIQGSKPLWDRELGCRTRGYNTRNNRAYKLRQNAITGSMSAFLLAEAKRSTLAPNP